MKHYVIRLFGIIIYFTEDKVEFIFSGILKNCADLWDYIKKGNEKAAEEFLEDRVKPLLFRYYED